MKKLNEIKEYITFWSNKPTSNQKTVVLTYWLKQLVKCTNNNIRNKEGDLVANVYSDKIAAFKTIAKYFKVPYKIKGEWQCDTRYRLVSLIVAF